MLKNRATYEIMRRRDGRAEPRASWCWASTRAATPSARSWKNWAIDLTREKLNQVFDRFKDLATRRRSSPMPTSGGARRRRALPAHGDLATGARPGACGTSMHAHGHGTLRDRGRQGDHVDAAIGTGPVDAVYKGDQPHRRRAQRADRVQRQGHHRRDRRGRRRDDPHRAAGTRLGTSRRGTRRAGTPPRIFSGRGIDTDIIVASARAYMQALNKLLAVVKAGAKDWRSD